MAPHIAVSYRLYFLYLEPLFALHGAYLSMFRPQVFLAMTVPDSLLQSGPDSISPSVSPLVKLLLGQMSSLFALFSFNEAVMLRYCSDLIQWKALISGCLLSDAGHLYANFIVTESAIFWNAFKWGADEWGNLGILWFGTVLRVAFLCGVGVANRLEYRPDQIPSRQVFQEPTRLAMA